MTYRMGRIPGKATKLRLADYVDLEKLPAPHVCPPDCPAADNTVGDSVFAAYEHMLIVSGYFSDAKLPEL